MGKVQEDYGYKSPGPNFWAQLYRGDFGLNIFECGEGDIANYAKKKIEAADVSPTVKLIRATFYDALITLEYAIRDLATIGEFRVYKQKSAGSKYSSETVKEAKEWLFLDDREDDLFCFKWCCELLEVNWKALRTFLSNRYQQAEQMANEIISGKRKKKKKLKTRVAGLFNETVENEPEEDFFCDLEELYNNQEDA